MEHSINIDDGARGEFTKASQITQEDARPVFELLSAGFEITWFREKEPRLWIALAKPSKELEKHFGLHFECFVIGHGFPKDFQQRTLLQKLPVELQHRADPSVRFVASMAPQADAACAAWASTNRSRIVLLRPSAETALQRTATDELYSLLAGSLWRRDQFAESEPVRLASEFYGREVAVNEVVGSVLAGQPLGVFGLRKVGKSSLLGRATDLLVANTSFLVVSCTIIGNSAKIRAARWHEVIGELLSGWVHGLEKIATARSSLVRPKIGKFREAVSRRLNDAALAIAIERDIISLLKTARTLADLTGRTEVRLLAVVDECDQLYPHLATSGHWRTDFFSLWNTLQAVKRGLDDPTELTYLLGGVNPSGTERGTLADQANPLFETQKLYLKPMSDVEAAALLRGIGHHSGLEFNAAAIQEAFSRVGGHPMLLRKLGSAIHKDEIKRAATITVDSHKMLSTYKRIKRSLFDYVMWVLEHLRQVAPDEELFLRNIALGLPDINSSVWSDNEYREVFAHHLEQYGLITFEEDHPMLALELVREALKRPTASDFLEQKKSLREIVDALEAAVRHRLVSDLGSTRSVNETIDAITSSIPGEAKNRMMTRQELKDIGEVSGVEALVQSLNWGDYETLLKKYYDEIRWHGDPSSNSDQLSSIKETFIQAHMVRHNNDTELRKLITKNGFEVVAGRWRAAVDVLTG